MWFAVLAFTIFMLQRFFFVSIPYTEQFDMSEGEYDYR